MLTLTRTPETEIKEEHLVPGSKWRRKSDGAECVLVKLKLWFMLTECGCGLENAEYYLNNGCLQSASEMLAWLRRDFERVGGAERNKYVGDIQVSHAFEYLGTVYIMFETTSGKAKVLNLRAGRIATFENLTETVVTDLGPITIDASVTGVTP